MCVPTTARRHRGETCTPRAARATRSSSPATAGREPAPGRAYVCRHRRVAIAARPARPAQLTRRIRPRPAESQRRAAHVCRHRRVAIAARPARPAQLTRRVHGRRRASAGPHVCVPPPAPTTVTGRLCSGCHPGRRLPAARADGCHRQDPWRRSEVGGSAAATRGEPLAVPSLPPALKRDGSSCWRGWTLRLPLPDSFSPSGWSGERIAASAALYFRGQLVCRSGGWWRDRRTRRRSACRLRLLPANSEHMERVYHQWQRLPYEIDVEHEIWTYSFPNMLERLLKYAISHPFIIQLIGN